MDNYYELLNVPTSASMDEIQKSYKSHIDRYKGLPFLTNSMKEEVKKYKIAKYVLFDYHRRKAYDNKLEKKEKDISKFVMPSRKIEYTEQDFDPRRFQFNESDYIIDTSKINERLFGDTFK